MMRGMSSRSLPLSRSGLAVLSFALAAGQRVQLLPAGPLFRARDGRPEKLPGFRIDVAAAAAIAAAIAARETPLVIDYEHQTLHTETNGQPAPAAGWFSSVVWIEGEGLFATDVQWTERARAMIAAGEYKFISPVFRFDTETGAVQELLMAAITNNPGIDGMDAVVAARFLASTSQPDQETEMPETLKKLLAGLGLQESATEAEAVAALSALTARAAGADGLASEVAALKAAGPDPAKYAPVAVMKSLQDQVAALTAQVNGRELDELVGGALQQGKLLPPQEAWARDLGARDVASLKLFVANAAPNPALTGTQTGGRDPGAGGGEGLSETDLAVCKAMGLAHKDFLAARAAA